MSQVILTSASANQKKEALQQANQQFKAAAESLFQTATRMNDWEGTSQKAFVDAITRDKTQMDNFHDLVDRFVQTLGQMIQKYLEAEARNTEIAKTRNY